jgi:hypothetical protein
VIAVVIVANATKATMGKIIEDMGSNCRGIKAIPTNKYAVYNIT